MFDRFTDRARKIMSLARQNSERLNHGYIGPEHILLGLLEEGTGTAAHVIENLDVDLTVLRAEIEKLVQPDDDITTMGQLPFTPRAKKVLEFAIDEAREFRHNHVGSEHLLLGLIREKEGLAAQALQKLNLTYERVRKEVQEFLNTGKPEPPVPPEPIAPAPAPGTGLFDRFTDRARKVMTLAKQEANRLKHDYIGTEHILLGLVQEGSGVAAIVLENLDVDFEKVRLEVEKLVKPAPEIVSLGQLPFSPRAKQVLEYAIAEARALDHNYVGTEHLLLGLVREKEAISAQILANLGLKLEDVHNEVLEFLNAENTRPKTETTLNAPPVEAPIASPDSNKESSIRIETGQYADEMRDVLKLAHENARRWQHDFIDAEHVFRALCDEGTGVAAKVCLDLGLRPSKVRLELEKVMKPVAGADPKGEVPYTADLMRALKYARREARRHGEQIQTEHVLVGLLKECRPQLDPYLRRLQVDPNQLCLYAMEYHNPKFPKPIIERPILEVLPRGLPPEPAPVVPEPPPPPPPPAEPRVERVIVEAVYRGKTSAWASALLMVSGGMLIGSNALALMFATRAESQLLSFFLLGLLLVFVGVVIGPWRAR